ncbi:MAG: hypothetical protein IT383_01605 [Deltaproteobacteria bacterium]|nr:hypothetical protein [Deltaproteobacteria bacterium]
MRATVVAAVVVGVCAGALWLVALLHAMPAPDVALYLLGEPRAVVGDAWPVRFGAARAGGTGPASLRGTIALGDSPERDAAAGFARLPVSAPGTLPGMLRVCLDDGAPCLHARFAVEAAAQRAPSSARFVWLGRAPAVATVGAVARRTAVGVRLAPELDASAPSFTVHVDRAAGPLLLDVVVDGVVRDVVRADGPSVAVNTPRQLAPGAVVVVHAGGPWPDELGAWATARVADPAEPLAAFSLRLARAAGAPDDVEQPADDEAARALLERLKPTTARAARLPVTLVPADPGPPWPELYLGAAALLATLVALAGRASRVPPLALVAGLGAVLGVCGGMYAVLLLVGR